LRNTGFCRRASPVPCQPSDQQSLPAARVIQVESTADLLEPSAGHLPENLGYTGLPVAAQDLYEFVTNAAVANLQP
jgi:hypothetical protein